MIYLIAYISMIVHFLMKIGNAVKKHGKEFNIMVWIKDPVNYVYILASMLIIVILLLSVDLSGAKTIMIGSIEFKVAYVLAIAFGYAPTSFLYAIIEKFKPKK